MVEGASDQLMELTLKYKDGISPEARIVTMTADPVKLQTLLYG